MPISHGKPTHELGYGVRIPGQGQSFFAIEALFCDAFGPNLRNEVAHGLVNDGDGNSAESAYAWWLLLKMVFSRFVATQERRASVADVDVPQKGEQDGPHLD